MKNSASELVVVKTFSGEEGMAVVITEALRGGGYNATLRDTDAEESVGGIVNATLAQAEAWARKVLGPGLQPVPVHEVHLRGMADAFEGRPLYALEGGYETTEERITLSDDQPDLFGRKKPPSIEEIWKAHAGAQRKPPKTTRESPPPGDAGVTVCNTEVAPYKWLDVSVCVSRQGRGKELKLPVVRGSADVVRVLGQIYPGAMGGLQEHILVLAMDVRNQPLGAVLVAKGGLAEASAGIADILRPVIMLPSKAFIIAHNHPSGHSDPSHDDDVLTVRVFQAGRLLGLKLLDHLILTADPKTYHSYADASSPFLRGG